MAGQTDLATPREGAPDRVPATVEANALPVPPYEVLFVVRDTLGRNRERVLRIPLLTYADIQAYRAAGVDMEKIRDERLFFDLLCDEDMEWFRRVTGRKTVAELEAWLTRQPVGTGALEAVSEIALALTTLSYPDAPEKKSPGRIRLGAGSHPWIILWCFCLSASAFLLGRYSDSLLGWARLFIGNSG